jgi:hypothetical protein
MIERRKIVNERCGEAARRGRRRSDERREMFRPREGVKGGHKGGVMSGQFEDVENGDMYDVHHR